MRDFRGNTARFIREKISDDGERFWKFSDFENLPPQAVAQTLSRLTRQGFLKRIRKGLYYRPRHTILGQSQPAASEIVNQIAKAPLHPTGLTAANILGFTTQNPGQSEFATSAESSPKFPGTRVYPRRPLSRSNLSPLEGGLLEFLRASARWSELSPSETCSKLLGQLRKANLDQLLKAVSEEPPRVRAMLGALGEQLRLPESKLKPLRQGLNPLSRFDFGPLRDLPSATNWQAA